METITEEFKIYSFDELSEEAKDKALTSYREGNDFYFLEENLKELLSELLEKHKIKGKPELRYSLSYCQGDGVSFIGNFEYKDFDVKIELGNLSNLYSHSNTTNIYIQNEEGEDAPENIYKEFEDLYQTICKDIENQGYAIIEDENSEEYISKEFKEREYMFKEDGSVYEVRA